MLAKAWLLVTDAIEGFIADECLSRGAAIAYYTVFSLAPLLIIATAMAGMFYGEEAARGALDEQIRGLVGQQAAETIQAMVAGASNKESGVIATVIGLITLLVTASGVFGELQASLNAVWKAEPPKNGGAVSRLVKAKAASLGLVAATGFLLIVSLVASALIASLGDWITGYLPGGATLLTIFNFVVSFAIISALFAAIYKILPDRHLSWRDVGTGAVATAFLFVIGKTAIGWYLGSSSAASTFGAASAFVLVLLWVYYSSQIFLLGAEFTRAFAGIHGTDKTAPVPAAQQTLRATLGRTNAKVVTVQNTGIWSLAGGVMMLAALARRLRSRN